MQNYPPRKKDRQPLQPRRGPERRWTASSPQPEPPDDQGAPAPLVTRSLGPEIPVLVGGLVSRGTSPRPRARPAVNLRPAACPVRPAAGDVDENPRLLLDLGNTARSSSKRPAPAARGPALVAAELFTDGDAPPRRGASSAGHRKSYAWIRSPDSEQCNPAATRNPVAHSTARNATHSNPEFGPVKSATLPVSTARRSRHSESVRHEIREHAEQAEARANAAYEQNRAALELIAKSMDNVRNAYAEAGRARDRFHDLLSVSSLTRHRVRRHQELRTSSDQQAERDTGDNVRGTADYQRRSQILASSTAAAQRLAIASRDLRSKTHSTSLLCLAERKDASADPHARVSTARLTPREVPRSMNTQETRVHEWVTDQRRIWSRRPAPEAPDPTGPQVLPPAARVDNFAHGNPGIGDTLVHQATADRRVSWLDRRTRSSTGQLLEPPSALHPRPPIAQTAATGPPGGSSCDPPYSFVPTPRVSYPAQPSQTFQRQERDSLPSREGTHVPEYLRAHRAPTFEPVTPGRSHAGPYAPAHRAAVLAPASRLNTPARQREYAGSIGLHNGGHNRPAQRKHPDRVTNMLSAAFTSEAQVAVRIDTLPLYKSGIKSLLPAPYGGQPDPTSFENWLSHLLGFFRTHQLVVLNEAQDRARLEILGQALEGRPHVYFWERYQQFQEQYEVWDFQDAILDLRDRFLSKNTPPIAANQTRLGDPRTPSAQQPARTVPNVCGASWAQRSPWSSLVSLHNDVHTESTASSHGEGRSPVSPARASLSAKSASQHKETNEVSMLSCPICGRPLYIEDCPPETWNAVHSIADEGTPAPMSDADTEYHFSCAIYDGRSAQSPEPDSQGLYGSCGDERYDPGGVSTYSYSLYSGSTRNLTIVPRHSEAPDPSAQTEGEPDWSDGTATGGPPPPNHEHDEYLEFHAHEEDMVWSSGSPQIPLEDHLEGEDSSAMICDDY